MKVSEQKLQVIFLAVILVLLFPALFINLGKMPISGDEGTRALVSLEMEYSGNLITPTVNGDFYFNKPPLYNWILLGFFKLSHSHSEFIIRLPAVISLLLFGAAIFLLLFKKYGTRTAFLSALSFITCGRILFYDSLNGYIDITFSLLVFLGFIIIYHCFAREKYLQLFIFSYLLCALAFLMKGLPALVFQGITLLVVFNSGKRFSKLFSLSHLFGLTVFLLATGWYYYMVFQQNPDFSYFITLVTESSKRTFVQYGLLKTFFHLFTFPIEQIYHLLPWSVMLIVLFSGKTISVLRKDDLLKYFSLVFIFNLPVYWISVESYPRYIFSLYPVLLFVPLIIILHFREEIPRHIRIIETVTGTGLFLIIPFLWLLPSFYEFRTVINPYLPALAGSVIVLLILFLYRYLLKFRLETVIIALLLFRIGFNLVVLPERYAESRITVQKKQAEQVGAIARGNKLFLAENAPMSHETSFYISRETGEILKRDFAKPASGCLYIIDGKTIKSEGETVLYNFETRWENWPFRLSRIK